MRSPRLLWRTTTAASAIKPHLKRASFGGLAPRPTKSPIITPEREDFNWMRACWRIAKLQMVEPYGWHELSPEKVEYIRHKLADYEAKDWNEIWVTEKKHNHHVEVSTFDCPKAREWMRRNLPDQDVLWRLRLTGTERVWGIFRDGVFHVIF